MWETIYNINNYYYVNTHKTTIKNDLIAKPLH
jgi:hypothetical protein